MNDGGIGEFLLLVEIAVILCFIGDDIRRIRKAIEKQ